VDQPCVGPGLLHPPDRGLTGVGAAVVNDPVDGPRRTYGSTVITCSTSRPNGSIPVLTLAHLRSERTPSDSASRLSGAASLARSMRRLRSRSQRRASRGRSAGRSAKPPRRCSGNTLEDTIADAARVAPRQAQFAPGTVKQVLRDAMKRGQRVDPALLDVKAPTYEEREPVFLSATEVEHLASWCSEPRLITFAALSGLRSGEVLALRGTDVNLEDGCVLVRRAARKAVEGRTKTRKRRRVYLCAPALRALRAQLVARRQTRTGWSSRRRARTASGTRITSAPTSSPRPSNALRRRSAGPARRFRAAGVPRSTPHIRILDDCRGGESAPACGGVGTHRPEWTS
jgi:integrase